MAAIKKTVKDRVTKLEKEVRQLNELLRDHQTSQVTINAELMSHLDVGNIWRSRVGKLFSFYKKLQEKHKEQRIELNVVNKLMSGQLNSGQPEDVSGVKLENERLSEDLENKNQEIQQLKVEKDKSSEDLENKNQEIQRLNENLAQMQSDHCELQAKFSNSEKTVRKLGDEIGSIKDRIMGTNEIMESTLKTNTDLENANKKLKDELNEERNRFKEENLKLTEKIAQSEEWKYQLEKQLQDNTKVIENIGEEKSRFEKENLQFRKQLMESKDSKKQWEESQKQFQEQTQNIGRIREERNRFKEENLRLTEKIAESEEKLKVCEGEKENLNELKAKMMADLQRMDEYVQEKFNTERQKKDTGLGHKRDDKESKITADSLTLLHTMKEHARKLADITNKLETFIKTSQGRPQSTRDSKVNQAIQGIRTDNENDGRKLIRDLKNLIKSLDEEIHNYSRQTNFSQCTDETERAVLKDAELSLLNDAMKSDNHPTSHDRKSSSSQESLPTDTNELKRHRARMDQGSGNRSQEGKAASGPNPNLKKIHPTNDQGADGQRAVGRTQPEINFDSIAEKEEKTISFDLWKDRKKMRIKFSKDIKLISNSELYLLSLLKLDYLPSSPDYILSYQIDSSAYHGYKVIIEIFTTSLDNQTELYSRKALSNLPNHQFCRINILDEQHRLQSLTVKIHLESLSKVSKLEIE